MMQIEEAIMVLQKIKDDYGNIPFLAKAVLSDAIIAGDIEEIEVQGYEGQGLSAMCLIVMPTQS